VVLVVVAHVEREKGVLPVGRGRRVALDEHVVLGDEVARHGTVLTHQAQAQALDQRHLFFRFFSFFSFVTTTRTITTTANNTSCVKYY